ncbi:MAG: hypothetical protein RIT28_535 [Pseudomonadota bacterium]|jgi:hypothetical protein
MTAAWLLLSTFAWAQNQGGFIYGTPGTRNDCEGNAPIAGTAGYRNARAAITTNSQVFSAATFAERELFPLLAQAAQADTDGRFAVSLYEQAATFGVTDVPTVETSYPFGSCPQEYRLAMRPLDLGAGAFGFAGRLGRLGYFYSSSVAFSATGFGGSYTRAMMSASYMIYLPAAVMLAPLNWDEDFGVSTISSDFIAGASYNGALGSVYAGYVSGRGGYLHFGEDRLGGFASALADRGLDERPAYLSAGFKGVQTPVGRTALYGRKLPITAPPGYAEQPTVDEDGNDTTAVLPIEAEPPRVPLRTVHLQQYDLFGRLDVLAAVSWSPEPIVHEAMLGLHSPGFGEAEAGWSLRVGTAALPDMYYYGVEGGNYVSARAEFYGRMDDDDGGGSTRLEGSILYNDAEQLSLYPYARGALSANIRVAGRY